MIDPSFQRVITSTYAYQEDMRISALRQDAYALQRYDLRLGWRAYDRALSEAEINLLLAGSYFQCSSGTDDEHPFSPHWRYRLVRTSWNVFRLWLLVWYSAQQRENKAAYLDYQEIIEQLETLPEKNTFHQWALKQRETHKFYHDVVGILLQWGYYKEKEEK